MPSGCGEHVAGYGQGIHELAIWRGQPVRRSGDGLRPQGGRCARAPESLPQCDVFKLCRAPAARESAVYNPFFSSLMLALRHSGSSSCG